MCIKCLQFSAWYAISLQAFQVLLCPGRLGLWPAAVQAATPIPVHPFAYVRTASGGDPNVVAERSRILLAIASHVCPTTSDRAMFSIKYRDDDRCILLTTRER
jgi:hypothetical protein